MWAEKHGKTWRIRDRVGAELVTLASGYPTKTAARDGIAQLRGDQLRGEALVARGGQVLLSDWLDTWWPPYASGLKPSARISAEGIIRRYIRSMLGHLALEDITPLVVKSWTADLLAGRTTRRPLAVKTVRNAHGVLHKVLQDAVGHRLIRANPCTKPGLPTAEHVEMRFLTEQEAERLLLAVPQRWRPLVLLLLFAGLRWGEAVGLRVGRVDVLGRKLVVLETMQELADHAEIVFVTPKTKRSRRTVTFPVRVAEELAELVAGRDRGELLFTALQGGPVRYRQFWRRIWKPSIERAGLAGLRLHDLRHTHVAWLISDGVPLTAISRRLGHASISVTSDRYGHLLPEVDAGIMTTLDRALDMIDFGSTVGATDAEVDGASRSNEEERAGQDASEAA